MELIKEREAPGCIQTLHSQTQNRKPLNMALPSVKTSPPSKHGFSKQNMLAPGLCPTMAQDGMEVQNYEHYICELCTELCM